MKKYKVMLTKNEIDILWNASHDQFVRAKQSGESDWARKTLTARNKVNSKKICEDKTSVGDYDAGARYGTPGNPRR